MCDCSLTHGLWPIDWPKGQGLKEHYWKMVRNTSGKEVCGQISPNGGENMKTLVSHGNAHQKVTSAEEELNNRVDSTIHSEGSQPLPKSFCHCLMDP